MKKIKQSAIVLLITVLFGLSGPVSVFAGGQGDGEYPDKPVMVISTFPAGGLADIIARVAAQALENELATPFQVINKPGGAHVPGVMEALGKPADGYTILHVTTPTLLSTPYINNSPYSYEDLELLFIIGQQKNVLYVSADSEMQTLQDFVDAAESRELLVGINAIGAPPHLSMEQFIQSAGLEVEYLTAGTIPKAAVAAIGGHSDAFVGQLRELEKYPDEIRALAVLDEQRHEILPGVPTVKEALPGMDVEATSWVRGGYAVKKGTPQEIIDVLVAAADRSVNTEEFANEFNASGNVFDYASYDEAQEILRDGISFYHTMIDELGLRK